MTSEEKGPVFLDETDDPILSVGLNNFVNIVAFERK
jgi:hypothetical protein